MSVDKSPTDTYPMRLLKVGDVVSPTSSDNEVTILACWLIRPSDVDAYAWWLVMCLCPDNPRHPFTVWDAYDRPDGWSMNNGDYCATIERAVKAYADRGGKYQL